MFLKPGVIPRPGERGQAVILVAAAMGIVLIAALGLAIDGSQLYAHRQMAQAAADSAAQAGAMTLFNKTNTGTNTFGSGPFTCTTADVRTPCFYARQNGVGSTSMDQVAVDFPTSAPGVNLSAADTPNMVRVTITRTVDAGLIRFVSAATSTIRAAATAAIVDVVSPTPILVLHPTRSGALSGNGTPIIAICGGPNRSIQVNSTSLTAISFSGGPSINLTRAGPLDPGNCSTGTGGDFGTFGGPLSRPSQITTGAGTYIQPASPILDPLASVPVPALPAAAPAKVTIAAGVSGCPAAGGTCKLYSPGRYSSQLQVKNERAVFKPGVYYIQAGGFDDAANGHINMSTGFPNDPNTGQGMLVYLAGSSILSVAANSSATMVGTPAASIYKGILFFSDRNAISSKNHQ
ncbi:MAG: pilus assembly protein TadG-related protein, partial [Acidobacteriota bacterium]